MKSKKGINLAEKNGMWKGDKPITPIRFVGEMSFMQGKNVIILPNWIFKLIEVRKGYKAVLDFHYIVEET